METKEFRLKPEKQKKRGNWKGKLAAALAGVLGASVIGPAIASFMPETADAAETKLYQNAGDPGEIRAGGETSRQDYNGNKMTVVRSAEQLQRAIQRSINEGWTSADIELVIFVDNSMTTTYNDGSYDKDSGELNCFVMDRTIEIPANANIRLVSTAGNNVKFVRTSDFNGSDSMFRVKGKLTVGENITMSGELTTKTEDIAEVANQQQCDDGSTPGRVIKYTEYVDVQTNDGNLGLNGYIYNSEGKVLVGAGDLGTTRWHGADFNNTIWADPASYEDNADARKKITWKNVTKTATNHYGTTKSINYLVNENSWAIVIKHDGSQIMVAPEWDLSFTTEGGDFLAKVKGVSQVKTHVEVKDGKLQFGYYSSNAVAVANVFTAIKKRVDHYYPEDRCANGQLPKTPVAGHPAGKKYGNSAAHTWDKSSSDGSYLNNNTGFFITQESGELTIDGGTFKDFNTVAGEGTYSKQPLGCAPIYVTNGKFTMNSGNIVNNTIGYTIGEDKSGLEAQDIKNHVQTKPETYTAGAIIFTGGNDHQLNGGLIAGNKADAGAIIVKTKNNHPFASDPSFSGHNALASWAASAPASSTKVTMGAGTSAGPTIAGNVGIHDSGAVFIWPVGDNDTAEVVMNAGKVQDNFSWYKGGAFNVCSEIDPIEHWKQDKKRANAKAIFDMNGGLIENNTAVCRGGAIEVVSDQVYLKAGIIRDNNSRTLGGAIYVEGDFADRLYTLYLPNTYVNNNNAWKETKAGQEASDYAYLKRKLVSGNRARLNADGTYTYDNPLGNVRNDNGSINDTNSNEGKKDWSPVSDGAKKWILSATRTGDWRDFPNHSGLGGGVWLCALGGYASINFFINDTNKPDLVGAYIDGNNGTKGNGQIDWDMTALAKDGGFTLSKANTNAQDQSEYVYLDRPSEHLVWNKLYSGKGARYDIVNSNNITTDNTQGGTKGVLITQNNARAGGGIASNGTVIFGQSGDIYRHSAETTFTKTWTGVTSKPMAFQAYIIKNDGTKVAIPGYQFILDGTAGDAQGGNGSVQSVVDETSGWTAKIQLPYGYDGTPVFEMTANNKTYDTLMSLWDIPGSVTTGTVTDWNFAVEEVPSLPHKKTGLVASNNYFLLKKVDENSGSETDRDPNFKTDGKYDAPINIGAQTEWPYTNFPDKYKSGLYFVKQYNGVTEVNETLFNGEYALVQGNGNVIEEFTISEGETEFASYNLVEKPSTVKLSQTHKEVDYKDKEGKTITKIHEYSTKAYTEGDNNNLKMDNSEREKPGVEKYINKKVDQDLDNIGQQFTYDIIAKVPDQAEEFAISDTLVDWIEYVGGTEAIQIKVLDNNDHLGNGSGTVATGKVNNTGNSVVNQALTSQVNAACEKIILNDTLTVRVTDKTVLKNLIGKYVQITINAQLDSKHYDDVMGKVASSDRQVTYNDNTVAYALKNDFDKENYTYRLYKVSDTETDGLVPVGSQKAGDFLTESEVKALGISADTKLVRSGRLGIDGSVQASFDPSKKAFGTLSAGKYVLHVMKGKIDDVNGQISRDEAFLDRCEVFEIIDGDEDIRWVSVAGTSQNSLPEAFKNDSPYMGEGKQQTDPQVVTGSTTDKKNTSDDPLHDGVGNRATFTVTYRGGRQQTLKTNTVTVEPQPETPKIEKYVNKKVDDTLAGFDSNFTYDIMAYIPNGVSTVVIDDTLVDWLEFASTENTLSQIRVLSDNDHLGTGAGTVATGSVNGNSKVVDVALDNKYTVEKTENRLKVTVNDRDTITQLWGNWVQVTFDAKIKESAYGAVVSKLNEKTDENDNRASVTYSNSQDKGTFTVNIKDTDDYYYRLYSRDQGAVNGFLYKRAQNLDWYITNNSAVSEATREKFGLTDWTESARTLEFNSSNVTTQISAANYRDYDSATGELVFKNLPTGSYFLYCFKKTGGGNEADRVVLGRCQAFEIDSKNFNWVEVDGGITFPKYLNSDTPVLDGSNDMHDGIGNRAGYTLSYKGGSTAELKTNVVTVEPPKEKFEITKVWEGDDVTVPTGDVETAFLNALKLKLGGEDIPSDASYDHALTVTSKGADGKTWTIKTPLLPTFAGKKYSLEEDLQSLKDSTNDDVKNFFKYYNVKYDSSINDVNNLKITDIVNNFDPENFAYSVAKPGNISGKPFDGGATSDNFEGISDLLGGGKTWSRATRFKDNEERFITSQAEFEEVLKQLPAGDYVLLAQEKNHSKTNEARWDYDSVRARSAKFTYTKEGVTPELVEAALKDEYGNTKLHNSTITLYDSEDRKIVAAREVTTDWTNNYNGHDNANGDKNHVKNTWNFPDCWMNKAYNTNFNSNDIIIDLATLETGTYFDITWKSGNWVTSADRRYDVINSTQLSNVRYSVYKKDAGSGNTLAKDIQDAGNTWKNGLAISATDDQKNNYKKIVSNVKEEDIKNTIKDNGEYLIVAENTSEYVVPLSLNVGYSDNSLPSGGTITNTNKLYKVRLRKVDSDGGDLTGAEFKLYHYVNNSRGDEVTNLRKDTANGAYYTADKLTEGEYEVVETKKPSGYDLLKSSFRFTINSDGSVADNFVTHSEDASKIELDGRDNFTIKVKNTSDTINLRIRKKWDDNDNSKNKRPNKITVYLKSDKDEAGTFKPYTAHNAKGEYVLEYNSQNTGWEFEIRNLPKYAYSTDANGNDKQRLIKYDLTEAPVDGYTTGNITVGLVNEEPVDNRTYSATTVINYADQYSASAAYCSYNGITSSYWYPYGSRKHTLTLNGKEVPAFCMNVEAADPGNPGKDPVTYSKVEVTKDTLLSYINTQHNTVNATSNAFGVGRSAYTYGNAGAADLYNRLLKIAHYGYPNDAKGLMSKYSLTEDEYRLLTANAIYEYTDWYYRDNTNGIDFRDKANHLWALENKVGLRDWDNNDSNYTSSDGGKVVRQFQIHGVNRRNAYRELMNEICSDDLSMIEGKKLYVYTTSETASNGKKYQNLFGVGELDNCAEITNTILPDVIFTKVDNGDEHKPINHNGQDGQSGDGNDDAAQFKLVTALTAEDAINAAPIYESKLDTTKGNAYRFEGVADGYYWLVETKAPRYYTIGKPVQVYIGQISETKQREVTVTEWETVTNYKALSYVSGTRNVTLSEAGWNDTKSEASGKYQVWKATADGLDNTHRLSQTNGNVTRYLTFAFNSAYTDKYRLHAVKSSGTDEGGYTYKQYTSANNANTIRTPGWKVYYGTIYQYRPFYSDYYDSADDKAYFTSMSGKVFSGNDSSKYTLKGSNNYNDSEQVIVQKWDGSKWVNASSFENNKEYRFLVEDGTRQVEKVTTTTETYTEEKFGVKLVNEEDADSGLFIKLADDPDDIKFSYSNELLAVELPNTGGSGTLWIFLTGAGAVAAAITGLAVRSRRRKNIDDNVA